MSKILIEKSLVIEMVEFLDKIVCDTNCPYMFDNCEQCRVQSLFKDIFECLERCF